jgi:AraC-like DNA-binding protein
VPTDAVERLLRTLDVGLDAFAICEIESGWRLTSAPMEADVLHFVLRGEGVLETEDEAVPIGPDTIVVVPAGAHKSIAGPGQVVREVAASDACTLVAEGVVSIRAQESRTDLVIACGSVSATYGGCYGLFEHLTEPLVERCPPLGAPFAIMLEELSRPSLGARVMAEALMKQCLILLLRDHMDRLGARSPLFGPLVDTRLARAVAAVIAQPAYPHSVKSLAATAGMSRSSFSARFLSSYDQTPLEFVQAVRLRTAARLLQTSELPVKSVSAAVGYSSRSHFSRAFRNAFGADPSTYRAAPGSFEGGEVRRPTLLGADRATRPAVSGERRSPAGAESRQRNANARA